MMFKIILIILVGVWLSFWFFAASFGGGITPTFWLIFIFIGIIPAFFIYKYSIAIKNRIQAKNDKSKQ